MAKSIKLHPYFNLPLLLFNAGEQRRKRSLLGRKSNRPKMPLESPDPGGATPFGAGGLAGVDGSNYSSSGAQLLQRGRRCWSGDGWCC